MVWHWLGRRQEEWQQGPESDEKKKQRKKNESDHTSCLGDLVADGGCCLGGCLLDLATVAILAGGAAALAATAVRSIAT